MADPYLPRSLEQAEPSRSARPIVRAICKDRQARKPARALARLTCPFALPCPRLALTHGTVERGKVKASGST